jgi:hypothetical protein
MGDMRGAYRVLVGRPVGKRSLRRPRHRWENNKKWILKNMEGKAWTIFIWLRTGTDGGPL